MKRLFYFLFVLCTSVMASAQSPLVATLTHNGNISTFYGASALSQAHEAAVDGDVINLSSGAFKAVDITKRLTIRGAGMDVNSETNTEPTIIQGGFSINKPVTTSDQFHYTISGTASGCTIENIYAQDSIVIIADSLTFIKCRIKSLERYLLPQYTMQTSNTYYLDDAYYYWRNITVINTHVEEKIVQPGFGSVALLNSVINNPSNHETNRCNWEFTNCLIIFSEDNNVVFRDAYIKNSILLITNVDGVLDSSNMLYYNIGCSNSGSGNIFNNCNNTTNSVKKCSDVFTITNTADIKNTYPYSFLTPEAQTTYLGTDGTQVGIYGGAFPFNTKPTGPQITSCNVANKTSADGKLSVDIVIDNGN